MIARVYSAINAVGAALAQDGVAKTRLNTRDNYLYRSIDDVLERLAPLLAQHRLCILPRVLERQTCERVDEQGGLLVGVALRVAFDLVSAEDASCHTIEAFGEALDAGDKATPKAMQSAYKFAVLQAFCIPAVHTEDADAGSHRLAAAWTGMPAGGWEQWCASLVETVQKSATAEDLKAMQDGRRDELAALARERPDLYRALGDAVTQKTSKFGPPGPRHNPVPEKAGHGRAAALEMPGSTRAVPAARREDEIPQRGRPARPAKQKVTAKSHGRGAHA